MASYSIQYIYTLRDKFSQGVRKLGKASQASGKLVRESGRAAELASAAIGRMGGASIKSAKGSDKLGASTKRATSTVVAIDRAAKSAAASLKAMGAAAATSMAKAAHAAAYVRGYGGKIGPNEAAAGRGAANILAGRKLDEQMRSAYMGGGAAGKPPGGRGGRGNGFLGGSMRIMGASGMGARMGAYGASPGMIAGMGGAFGAHSLLNNFADFEESEIMVKAIGRRLGNSEAALDALAKQARQLGATTIFEPQDVLKGSLLFLKAGRSAQEAMVGIPQTLNLAAVAGIDVAKATEVSLNLMAQGRIPAEQLGTTMDAMTATFLNSKSELLGLAQAANYAVPILTQVGVPIEQQFAALGALAEGGQSGTRGARALRQIFTTMQKLPFDEKKAGLLKKFGVNVKKYFDKGKLKDFTGFIQAMGEAEERSGNSLFARLFPANAITGMQTLVAQQETLARVLNAVPNFQGVNASLSTEKFKGLTGSFRQLSAAWSELGVAFGKSGAGQYVEQAVRNITSLLGELGSSLQIGSFIEELFDPASMALAATSIGLRVQSTITRGVVGGIQGFLNTLSESVGLGASGDWLVDGLGLNKLMDRLDQSIEKVDGARSSRMQTVRDRVAQRGLNSRVGAFSRDGFNQMMSGVKLPDDPVPKAKPDDLLPTRNPNRIPQAAGERIKVESTMKGQIEPLAVTVTAPNTITLRLPNGMIAGSVPVGASSNAPRGVSAIDHGSSVIAP